MSYGELISKGISKVFSKRYLDIIFFLNKQNISGVMSVISFLFNTISNMAEIFGLTYEVTYRSHPGVRTAVYY